MELYRERYPWNNKLSVVGWRGGVTGLIHNATTKCPRWNMVHIAQQIESQRTNQSKQPLLDVAINNIPPRAGRFKKALEADIGVIDKKQDTMDFIEFQKYRAILDIDGNSWSGRFGSLLCFNSVILKVEPTFVDYFYNQYHNPNIKNRNSEHSLQPWKHYIPVKEDFSDLEQQAEFALNPLNEEKVLQIVQNANDWCRRTMIDESFAIDMLNVWERYVQLLYINDSNWNTNTWKNKKIQILDSASPFQMIELSESDYPIINNVVEMVPALSS
jgi:hypothetical protein